MTRAQIATQWVGTGTDQDPYRFKLLADYPTIAGSADVTLTPIANIAPIPNALVVEAVMDDATLAAIEADPNYGPGAVIWSEAA